jgi:hypothetical protein
MPFFEEFSPCFVIPAFKCEFVGKNICQLGTKTISATHYFLLFIIIVATCEQMTKDKFRNIDFMLFVNNYRDSLPIVMDRNISLLLIDLYFE